MGVGKTPQAIWAADIAGIQKILVLCPGIARTNWEREFHRWQTRARTVGVVENTQTVPQTDVVIASYNAIMAFPILRELIARRWGKLICDESHYMKNREALRTKIVFGALCDGHKGLAASADGTWLLTGTPFPNGPHEAWTFTRALFPYAVKGLEVYEDWVNQFCQTEPGIWNLKIVDSKNLGEFSERLRPHVLRRLLRTVQPELPPCRFGHVIVAPETLPPAMPDIAAEISAVIEAAKAKLISIEANYQNSEASFLSAEASEALLWVAQTQLASLRRWTGVAKAPAVAEALREDLANGLKKLVVFAVHREVIEILRQRLPDAEEIHGGTPQKRRQTLIDAFQGRVAGHNPRVLICNIEIASTALTLTESADVAFAETTWVPKDVAQGVHRVWRLGQKRPVLARVFSLRGSLDEAVSATLVRKANLVSRVETGLASL